MSKVDINFVINGRLLSQEEIRAVEAVRTKKVIKELIKRGETITYNGNILTEEEVYNIDFEEAKEALAETKEKIGNERMLDIYKKDIEKSNEMWREIAENSPAMENLQPCIISAEVRGLAIEELMKFTKAVYKDGKISMISKFNPENYLFVNDQGAQIILKRFGMYREPSFWKIEFYEDGFSPAEVDDDTETIMHASIKLASDGTDTKIVVMHQFKPAEDGFKMKLGVFLPQEAPAAMIDGRKWQFAVEYNNIIQYAAEAAGKNV
ncbi:MAG: hypothetical protein Q4F66_13275 [Clostridium sp.]|nr:hypothetical protein [Clostridium sp.]